MCLELLLPMAQEWSPCPTVLSSSAFSHGCRAASMKAVLRSDTDAILHQGISGQLHMGAAPNSQQGISDDCCMSARPEGMGQQLEILHCIESGRRTRPGCRSGQAGDGVQLETYSRSYARAAWKL